MPAKYRVEITATAEGDIEEIWTYIAMDSVENATRFVTQLEKASGGWSERPTVVPQYLKMSFWERITGTLSSAITV